MCCTTFFCFAVVNVGTPKKNLAQRWPTLPRSPCSRMCFPATAPLDGFDGFFSTLVCRRCCLFQPLCLPYATRDSPETSTGCCGGRPRGPQPAPAPVELTALWNAWTGLLVKEIMTTMTPSLSFFPNSCLLGMARLFPTTILWSLTPPSMTHSRCWKSGGVVLCMPATTTPITLLLVEGHFSTSTGLRLTRMIPTPPMTLISGPCCTEPPLSSDLMTPNSWR